MRPATITPIFPYYQKFAAACSNSRRAEIIRCLCEQDSIGLDHCSVDSNSCPVNIGVLGATTIRPNHQIVSPIGRNMRVELSPRRQTNGQVITSEHQPF